MHAWIILWVVILCVGMSSPAIAEKSDGRNLKKEEISSKIDRFIQYAIEGKTNEVELIIHSGMNVNEKGSNGITALIGAALTGQSTTVGSLLAVGADVNLQTESGGTALMAAAASRQIEEGKPLIA